ncbi:hypothetical protein [Sporosarcina sp. A2]|uniref:hypothetical protein n=1 Tax=Sporosarcina sp. A2 TaxID=3393449 RepID=UPI003D79F452
MHELKQRLRNELQQSIDNSILSEQAWALTTYKLAVSFETITKTKMDVLMKMMLISMQELPIEHPDELAQVLGVELLFIEDLLSMMKGAGLVTYHHGWVVTKEGIEQLSAGMLLHETESDEVILQYSAVHKHFMDIVNIVEEDQDLDVFRYEVETANWRVEELSDEEVKKQLAPQVEIENTLEKQRIVASVTKLKQLDAIQIPCLEFHVHHKSQDSIYARIWNTQTQQWDETLEQLVMSKERNSWRQRYIPKQEETIHET